MRLSHVAHALHCEPWAVKADMYFTMHEILEKHMRGDMPESSAFWGNHEPPTDASWEDPEKLSGPMAFETIEGVAVIPVSGVLGKRMSSFEKSCGGCDYDDFQLALAKSEDDSSVRAAVVDFDTPGGNVTGLREAAQAIKDYSKPIVGFTELVAASAGYYMMSGCDAIYAAYSSQVGCIGTIMSFLDISKAYEERGWKREVISSGDFKGMGMPGTSLTEKQRDLLQSNVDRLAQEFFDWVRSSRGAISDEFMQGQCFRGNEAAIIGLVDRIGDLADAINEAKAMAARR